MMRPRDFFADVAATYDGWYETPLGAWIEEREMQALDAVLGRHRAALVLEPGAGTGRVAAHLAGTGRTVVALEPSIAMSRIGRQRTAALPVSWVRARAERLPSPSSTFDEVIFFTTLEFVANADAAITEALRVLRPKGHLIVGFLEAVSRWADLYRSAGAAGDPPWNVARFFVLKDLESLVGFSASRREGAVFLSPGAAPPFEEADKRGRRAGNPPALEIASWILPT